MLLDASQSTAVAELDERLKAEADVLSVLQQKAMHQLEINNQRESSELEQKIELRRTLLDQKVGILLSVRQSVLVRCTQCTGYVANSGVM